MISSLPSGLAKNGRQLQLSAIKMGAGFGSVRSSVTMESR